MKRSIVFLAFMVICSCDFFSPQEQVPQNAAFIDLMIQSADKIKLHQADTSLNIAREAYAFARELKYDVGIAKSSKLIGSTLYQMGAFSPASQYLHESLSIFERLRNQKQIAEINCLLGNLYIQTEKYTTGHQHLVRAKSFYTDSEDVRGLSKVYSDLGHLFEKIHQYDSALSFQEQALTYNLRFGDSIGLAVIYENMGSIYEDLKDYDQAYTHFNNALKINELIDNETATIGNLNNIGDIHRKKGNYAEAIKFSTMALEKATKAKLDYQIQSAYRDLSKAHGESMDYINAFIYLNLAYDMNARIYSQQIAREVTRTQATYELEKKQQRIQLLEQEKAYNNTLSNITLFGSLLLLTIGAFIIYQQRSKTEKKRKLFETEAELTKTELLNVQLREQTLRAELENKRLHEEQLKRELEMKSKSLTNTALHLVQKNEFLDSLRSNLKKIKKTDSKDLPTQIKRLTKSIDLNFSLDDDWQEFETVFQQVHSDFFNRLLEMYPDLSSNEVRLCAMIRLNLHSKEIAAIMGISHDSLRIARYRLRKKLGLSKGANLYTFIMNLSS